MIGCQVMKTVYPAAGLYWLRDILVRANDCMSGCEDSLPSGRFVLEEGHPGESQWLAVRLWRQSTQRQVCTGRRTSWWEPMIGCKVVKTVYPAAGLYWKKDILVRANDWLSGCEDSLPSGRFVLEEGHPGESQWLAVRLWRQSTQRQVCTGRRTSWWEPMIGCQVVKTVYPAAGLYWKDILVRANDWLSVYEDSVPSGRFVLVEGHPSESQWLDVRLWRQSTQRQVCTGRRTSWWEPMIGCQVVKTVYPAAGLYWKKDILVRANDWLSGCEDSLASGRFVLEEGHPGESQWLAVRFWRQSTQRQVCTGWMTSWWEPMIGCQVMKTVYPAAGLYWMKDILVRANDWLSGYEDSLPSGRFVLEEGHAGESQWLAVWLWRQSTQRQVCTGRRTSWWEPIIGCQFMKTVYPAAGLYWLRDILVRANDWLSGCEDSVPSGRFVLDEGHRGERQWLAVRLWRQCTQRQVCTGRRTCWWERMIGCIAMEMCTIQI